MASLAFHAGILALLGTFRPGAMPPGTPSEPEPAQVTALQPVCRLFDAPRVTATAAAPPEALAEPLPEPDWSALRPALLPQQPNEEETPQASELEDLATPPPASTEVTANPAAVAQFAKLRYAEAALASGTDAGDWANVKQRSSTAPAGGDGVASGGGGPGSGDGVGLGGDGRSGTGSGSGSGLGHGTGAGTGTAAAGKPAGLGGGPSRPARLVRARPGAYPAGAREAGIEGTVQVRVLVLADGTVGSASLWRSSGSKELDDAALEAVKQWTFEPAQRDGQPAPSWATVSYRYELRSN